MVLSVGFPRRGLGASWRTCSLVVRLFALLGEVSRSKAGIRTNGSGCWSVRGGAAFPALASVKRIEAGWTGASIRELAFRADFRGRRAGCEKSSGPSWTDEVGSDGILGSSAACRRVDREDRGSESGRTFWQKSFWDTNRKEGPGSCPEPWKVLVPPDSGAVFSGGPAAMSLPMSFPLFFFVFGCKTLQGFCDEMAGAEITRTGVTL